MFKALILDVTLNSSKGYLARPYDSFSGVSSNFLVVFLIVFVLFVLFVAFKVWRSLKK